MKAAMKGGTQLPQPAQVPPLALRALRASEGPEGSKRAKTYVFHYFFVVFVSFLLDEAFDEGKLLSELANGFVDMLLSNKLHYCWY